MGGPLPRQACTVPGAFHILDRFVAQLLRRGRAYLRFYIAYQMARVRPYHEDRPTLAVLRTRITLICRLIIMPRGLLQEEVHVVADMRQANIFSNHGR